MFRIFPFYDKCVFCQIRDLNDILANFSGKFLILSILGHVTEIKGKI